MEKLTQGLRVEGGVEIGDIAGQVMEKFVFASTTISSWDIGGSMKIRPIYPHMFRSMHALVYVVAINQDAHMAELAEQELVALLREEETKTWPILILLNQVDVEKEKSTDWYKVFQNRALFGGRTWFIQETIALTGEGLEEGFKWLGAQILKK